MILIKRDCCWVYIFKMFRTYTVFEQRLSYVEQRETIHIYRFYFYRSKLLEWQIFQESPHDWFCKSFCQCCVHFKTKTWKILKLLHFDTVSLFYCRWWFLWEMEYTSSGGWRTERKPKDAALIYMTIKLIAL